MHNKRIFGLDILRFIAIATVVIGHTFYTLPIGADPTFVRCVFFDGVNIFFTLSGFLIGGILLKKLSEKTSVPVNNNNFLAGPVA